MSYRTPILAVAAAFAFAVATAAVPADACSWKKDKTTKESTKDSKTS